MEFFCRFSPIKQGITDKSPGAATQLWLEMFNDREAMRSTGYSETSVMKQMKGGWGGLLDVISLIDVNKTNDISLIDGNKTGKHMSMSRRSENT